LFFVGLLYYIRALVLSLQLLWGRWVCSHSSHSVQYIICVYLSCAFLYIAPWFHAKMAMYNLQRYLWNLNLIQHLEENVICFCNLSIASYKQEMSKVTSHRNRKWKRRKTWIYNSYIRQSFLGIAIFARRVTWHYAYNSFKYHCCSWYDASVDLSDGSAPNWRRSCHSFRSARLLINRLD